MADLTYAQLMNEVRRGFGTAFHDQLQLRVEEIVEEAEEASYDRGFDGGYESGRLYDEDY